MHGGVEEVGECGCKGSKVVKGVDSKPQAAMDREADTIRNILSENTYEKLWLGVNGNNKNGDGESEKAPT